MIKHKYFFFLEDIEVEMMEHTIPDRPQLAYRIEIYIQINKMALNFFLRTEFTMYTHIQMNFKIAFHFLETLNIISCLYK